MWRRRAKISTLMAWAAGVGWAGRKRGRFSPLLSPTAPLHLPPVMQARHLWTKLNIAKPDSPCQKGDLLFEIKRTHEFPSFLVKTFYDKIQTQKTIFTRMRPNLHPYWSSCAERKRARVHLNSSIWAWPTNPPRTRMCFTSSPWFRYKLRHQPGNDCVRDYTAQSVSC